MPDADRGKVQESLLRSTAELALAARRASSWAAAVPWEVFLNEVLPYRSLDEPLDSDWRALFAPLLAPLVEGAQGPAHAAQILNREVWKIWGLHFKSDQAPEILSPRQVIDAGYGSCSALSIFLVAACRSVGVPARVAGTPSWVEDRRAPNERFNNHNWVEVWDNSTWSFTDAAGYDPRGFNFTWFFPLPAQRQLPGSLMHAIYAASYRPAAAGTHFPLAWAPHFTGVPGLDVTQHYLDTVLPE